MFSDSGKILSCYMWLNLGQLNLRSTGLRHNAENGSKLLSEPCTNILRVPYYLIFKEEKNTYRLNVLTCVSASGGR